MTVTTETSPEKQAGKNAKKKIIRSVLAVYLLGFVVIGAAFGLKGHKNEDFNIVEPFHLDNWAHLFGPIDINKGVLYLLITVSITLGILLFVAKRMTMRPNRIQTAVEVRV